MSAPVDEDVVRSIIEQVWESLLRSEAIPWFGPERSDAVPAVRAQVELSGDWNGSVRLSCDAGTAERIAGTMLSAAADERLDPEDVHDAVGEVVNVVGGNFKGALGGATSLGLPVVLDAGTARGPQSEAPASRCVVDWRGEPVVVEVFARP